MHSISVIVPVYNVAAYLPASTAAYFKQLSILKAGGPRFPKSV